MSASAQNLQQANGSGRKSLARLLSQTKLIAAKLRVGEVEGWVDLELTGYAEGTEPPNYRRVFTQSLEIYNAYRERWQFAGNLHYALQARQPIAEIENFSREKGVNFPVSKSFSIKNDFGDPFGSDWPQRFVVAGSQYKRVMNAVIDRWTPDLEQWGLKVYDFKKLMEALNKITGDDVGA